MAAWSGYEHHQEYLEPQNPTTDLHRFDACIHIYGSAHIGTATIIERDLLLRV
jgi:hypothetical protein